MTQQEEIDLLKKRIESQTEALKVLMATNKEQRDEIGRLQEKLRRAQRGLR